MLNYLRISFICTLFISAAPVLANSSGLLMNDDSVQIFYQTNNNDTVWKFARQEYSLTYSQESNPRDLLFSADAEPRDLSRTLLKNYLWGPKLALHVANFDDDNLVAAALGIYLRHPAKDEHDFDFVTELMAAPQMTSLIDGKWLWSFKSQINLPLADDAELNFGFRKIQIKLDDKRSHSFETGLYLGLSRRF